MNKRAVLQKHPVDRVKTEIHSEVLAPALHLWCTWYVRTSRSRWL